MPSSNPDIRIRRKPHGFTLVEIMVGMAIAMLGIIILMQLSIAFEGQKRTTTSGDDIQNAGAIALYGIQQSVQQAGYCFSGTPVTLAAVGNLSPVMIDVTPLNDSSLRDANTNTLLVSYGNDACAPETASGVASSAFMNIDAYAVKDGNLMHCDYVASDCAAAANWSLIAGGIVSMKAECVSNQTIRIALVARSPQLEKTEVTASVPSWSGTSAIVLPTSGYDSGYTWKNYRYKTFETLAPIRNTLWTGATGC